MFKKWLIIAGLILQASLLSAQTVNLFADSVSGLPGSQVVVPVRVAGFQNIVSAQGTVTWDTAVVR